MQNLFIIRVIE